VGNKKARPISVGPGVSLCAMRDSKASGVASLLEMRSSTGQTPAPLDPRPGHGGAQTESSAHAVQSQPVGTPTSGD